MHIVLLTFVLLASSVVGQDVDTPVPEPEPTPAPVPDPTPAPVPDPTPAPVPDPTPEPTEAPDTPEPTPVPATPEPTDKVDTPEPTPEATDGPDTPQPTPAVVTPIPTTASPVTLSPVLTSTSPSFSPTNRTFIPTPEPTPFPTTPYPTVESNIDYFAEPRRRWSVQLNASTSPARASGRLGKGNSVTVSPDNGLVYVTMDDGSLEVLSASNGASRFSFTPQPNPSGWEVTCQSGVYWGESDELGVFAVYAIVDKAPIGSGQDSQSRIVAIQHGGNIRHLWTSPPLQGIVVGNPIVTRRHLKGMFMFVLHNINTASGTETPSGVFSVLDIRQGGRLIFSEQAGSDNPADKAPYSPMGVAHFPLNGNFEQGFSNNNDLVIWATSTENGFSFVGHTRAFQLPLFWQPTDGVSGFRTHRLNGGRWTAVAAPAIAQDGQGLFFGIVSSQLRGWWGQKRHDRGALWTQQLSRGSPGNKPIQSAPVLSTNDRRFYVASAATSFAGIDVETGRIHWQQPVASAVLTEARVSPDDRRVYAIQSAAGVVVSYDQFTGEVYWSVSCFSFETGCPLSSVVSEFSLSSNGLVLFYGSQNGRVHALQIGDSLTPTVAPTDYPTVMATNPSPTNMVQTTRPTWAPSVSPRPSVQASASPSGETTRDPTRGPTSSPAPTDEFFDPFATEAPTSMGVRMEIASVVGVATAVTVCLTWMI